MSASRRERYRQRERDGRAQCAISLGDPRSAASKRRRENAGATPRCARAIGHQQRQDGGAPCRFLKLAPRPAESSPTR
jgi:hypothetical protein